MSNYKGFPLCQANEVLEPRSGSIRIWCRVLRTYRFTALTRIASSLRARCGRTNYNRSLMQLLALRTLMKDARGGLIR